MALILMEVHVTANVTQHIFVDVNEVVGGKAEDYVDQIMSAFSAPPQPQCVPDTKSTRGVRC